MVEEEFKEKYIDKIIRVETNEGRIIIGKVKCIDCYGNLYLIETVEVFDRKSDRFFFFKLYENHPEHSFYFDSEQYNYQLYSNCIIPMKEIAKISMLKKDSVKI